MKHIIATLSTESSFGVHACIRYVAGYVIQTFVLFVDIVLSPTTLILHTIQALNSSREKSSDTCFLALGFDVTVYQWASVAHGGNE